MLSYFSAFFVNPEKRMRYDGERFKLHHFYMNCSKNSVTKLIKVKKAEIIMLAILLLTHISASHLAFAWNPSTSDLAGTGTSTDNSVADALSRFDIDSTTAGIQTGEDADSLAFSIQLQASQLLQSSPIAETTSVLVLNDPIFARDGDMGTAATFLYDSQGGLVQHHTFVNSTTGTIVSVDLYVRASVTAGVDDTYALSWDMGGVGETDLWAASSSARTLQDYSWLNLPRPGGGSWSWSDVGNFEVNWKTLKTSGKDGAVVSVYEVWLIVTGYGFSATGMTANDQYEIDFTLGDEDFAMLFQATGAAAGIMKLFYRATGGGAWSNGDTHTVGTIVSGTAYQSVSTDIGFTLTDSTASTGYVKFVVTKNYLATLGATSNAVTGIFAANFAGGTGEAGSGGATPNDRSPSSGGASWTLTAAIPDFPFGTLILVLPVMSIYLILKRQQNSERKSRLHILPEHMMNSSKLQYLLVFALLVMIAFSIQSQKGALIGDEEVEAGLIESGDRPALYFKLRNTGDDLAYYTYTVTCTYKRAVTDSSTGGEVTRETSPVVVSPGRTFSYSIRLVAPYDGVLDLNLKIFRGVQFEKMLLREQTWVIESK